MSEGKTEIELPEHVLGYLEQQSAVTLATASPQGVPRAATLLYVNKGPLLYMWIRPETTTAKHVEQNPLVSFAIGEYSDDWRQTRGVQGNGECEVVLSGEEIAQAAFLFGEKFPNVSSGSSTMGIYFLKVAATQVQFIDNSKAGEKSAEEFGVDYHADEVLNVWSDLPQQESGNIEAQLQSVSADAGEVLVRQGGPADKFFIVVEGELELVREEDGREQQLGSYGPGHFFGEMSIMRDSPRSGTIRATMPSRLLTMERETFRELVAESLGTTADFDQIIRRRMESLSG
jgi:CRP-like cAMP-binding protein/nitroimidazol reductase NimA-like FMN-containing flavoprotein (pyridoxamine 5'-phosphate oxidase superfamily)